jgi:asparagine synthase (glutamine-hydrolysing)
MCGICGVVGWGDRPTIDAMNAIQIHRGPDDGGVWDRYLPDNSYLALGSRRLAILDLSPAGHMPMGNDDGSVWITYNGEIYNYGALRDELIARGHRFRSHTDTEVLLRLYEAEGVDCLRRLNGMFAFAICDLRRDPPSLILARDHFGIKPLYYVHDGARLAFASEAKALFELPGFSGTVDPDALHQYLTFLWVPEPKTILSGVRKVPAGHYAVFRDGRLDLQQYWDLSFPRVAAPYRLGEAELTEEIGRRFRQAVRSQMVSDVPVGAFLSAGLDSTSIVAMMAGASVEPLRTYTITFPAKYRIGETTLDDPAVAARVARRFGCDHQQIVVEPEVADLLPRLIWHMDEPVADPAIITAYLVCREARRSVTVLLSGIGGDELFAGYRKHFAHAWAARYQRLPAFVRRRLVEPGVASLPSLRGTRFKGPVRLARKLIRSAALSPQDAFLMNGTYLDGAQKERLYTPELRALLHQRDPSGDHRAHFDRVADADFLHQMLYLDSKLFMASLNLNYNDKMSMASSVEVRVPFLDREFAEFVAWHVPPELKLKGVLRPTTKYILRQAMQGILPDEVLRQPKAGFGAPVDYWLSHDLSAMVDDLLSPRRLRERGYFDPAVVGQLVREQRAGRQDWSLQVWQLLTLELWMQAFVDRRPAIAGPGTAVQWPAQEQQTGRSGVAGW